MKKKIHIIGSTGSGKSFIARQLSKELGIRHYELDDIKYSISPLTGKKVSFEERIKLLDDITEKDEWIVEGIHHSWINGSLEAADIIFFLTPNVLLRDVRMINRFFKTRLSIEESHWKHTFKDLVTMIDGNHKFEKEKKPLIIDILKRYSTKTVILNDNNKLLEFII